MSDPGGMKMSISVYNTLSGEKEDFVPREPGKVGIYVCGVTPYDEDHLGHARPSIFWDVVRRFFRSRGYDVRFIQNFTDVDDKIINRAQTLGEPALELARRYSEEYLAHLRALGVEPGQVYPRVSEHIPQIIALIQRLVEKGHAYAAEGNVYFSVKTFPEYGKLSGRTPEELMVGARVEPGADKRDPLDFALWKKAKPGEPSWDSPWGPGRPGWHIECSAMSSQYLGYGFDFHGGGMDLIFPHHENEIAQSEAAEGKEPFVRHWIHHGMITVDGEKMSKSLGNFVTTRELLDRYAPEVIRFYVLSVHYRSPLNFSEENMEQAKSALERIHNAILNVKHALRVTNAAEEDGSARAGGGPATPGGQETPPGGGAAPFSGAGLQRGREPGSKNQSAGEESPASLDEGRPWPELARPAREALDRAMEDDFNTAQALAAVFDFTREVNSLLRQEKPEKRRLEEILATYSYFGQILGLFQEVSGPADLEAEVAALVHQREQARREKNWALADQIRQTLKGRGIILEDTPLGTRWKRG